MFKARLAAYYASRGKQASERNSGKMAVAFFRRELALRQKCGSKSEYLNCKLKLADTLGKFDEYKQLLELLDGAESDCISEFGRDSLETAKALYLLGVAHCHLGSPTRSVDCLHEAWEIAVAIDMLDSLIGSQIFQWLGQAYLGTDNLEEAAVCLRGAIIIRQKLVGEKALKSDIDLANCHYLLGNASVLQYKFDEAYWSYNTFVAIYQNIFGKVEENVALGVICVSDVLDCQGKLSEALDFVGGYIDWAREASPTNENAVAMLEQQVYNLKNGIGKLQVRVGGKKLGIGEAIEMLNSR